MSHGFGAYLLQPQFYRAVRLLYEFRGSLGEHCCYFTPSEFGFRQLVRMKELSEEYVMPLASNEGQKIRFLYYGKF